MKKSIIAGAGVLSLAAAAMPFMGVFATDDHEVVDAVTVTVQPTCSFETKGNGDAADGSYTATKALNGAEAEFSDGVTTATHTFNIVCNNEKGYTVSAIAAGLDGRDTDDEIAYKAATDYSTAVSGVADAGAWNASVTNGGDASAAIGTTSSQIASSTGTTGTAGKEFTVTYKVYVGKTTAADTYTGTVTYTLTPTPAS